VAYSVTVTLGSMVTSGSYTKVIADIIVQNTMNH